MFGNIIDKYNQTKEAMEAKKMLDKFNQEAEKIVTEEYEGKYKIVIRGNQTIDVIYENGVENNELKKVLTKAFKEAQKNVAKKMRNRLSEFGFPGL